MNSTIIHEVAAHFGTPAYCYDTGVIANRYQLLRNQLHSACDVYYSMKANPLLGICEFFQTLDTGCEVCSENELRTALKSGFSPKQIIFVGPYKTESGIRLAIQKHIRAIVCESIAEILRVDQLSRSYGINTPILLRLNPEFCVADAPIKMSGVSSQFGISLQVLYANKMKINQCQNINVFGIHVYNASRVLSVSSIVDNVRNILQMAIKISQDFYYDFTCIDFGGGFGVPYFEGETELDLEHLIADINELIINYRKKQSNICFILELGRYLVAESGFFITRIQSIKSSHGKRYAICDGGFNCFMAATGLGSFVHRNYPIKHIIQKKSFFSLKNPYQIVGPLCTPGDSLLRSVTLSRVSVGDVIAIQMAGAYGLTASPGRFLSHGTPAEVILYRNKYYLARERETYDELMRGQISFNDIYKGGETDEYRSAG